MSEQYPWLYVGAKVTTRNADPWFFMGPSEVSPEFGHVYTVRDVISVRGEVGIRLMEIVNPLARQEWGMDECIFEAVSFRPVRTISTDSGMAILRKIDADVFQNDSVPA